MSNDEVLDLAPEKQPTAPEKSGFWKKLKKGLLMTHTEVLDRLDAAVSGRGVVDDETLEYLEETLIATDIGVEASLEMVEAIKDRVKGHEATDVVKLREMLVDEMAVLLLDAPQPQGMQDTPVGYPAGRGERGWQDDVSSQAGPLVAAPESERSACCRGHISGRSGRADHDLGTTSGNRCCSTRDGCGPWRSCFRRPAGRESSKHRSRNSGYCWPVAQQRAFDGGIGQNQESDRSSGIGLAAPDNPGLGCNYRPKRSDSGERVHQDRSCRWRPPSEDRWNRQGWRRSFCGERPASAGNVFRGRRDGR